MSATRRPWYRLHAVTWIAGAMVGLLIFSENAFFPWVHNRWAWGWPRFFVGWDFDDGVVVFRPTEFRPWSLLCDIVVGLLLLSGMIYTVEAWRRRNGPFRVRLRTLFVATAWAASLLALELQFYRLGQNWTFFLAQIQIAVTHVTLAAAWLAVFDVAEVAFKKFGRRQ